MKNSGSFYFSKSWRRYAYTQRRIALFIHACIAMNMTHFSLDSDSIQIVGEKEKWRLWKGEWGENESLSSIDKDGDRFCVIIYPRRYKWWFRWRQHEIRDEGSLACHDAWISCLPFSSFNITTIFMQSQTRMLKKHLRSSQNIFQLKRQFRVIAETVSEIFKFSISPNLKAYLNSTYLNFFDFYYRNNNKFFS